MQCRQPLSYWQPQLHRLSMTHTGAAGRPCAYHPVAFQPASLQGLQWLSRGIIIHHVWLPAWMVALVLGIHYSRHHSSCHHSSQPLQLPTPQLQEWLLPETQWNMNSCCLLGQWKQVAVAETDLPWWVCWQVVRWLGHQHHTLCLPRGVLQKSGISTRWHGWCEAISFITTYTRLPTDYAYLWPSLSSLLLLPLFSLVFCLSSISVSFQFLFQSW